MAIEKFKLAETDANRVRKLNLLRDTVSGSTVAGAATSVAATVNETGGTIRTVLTLDKYIVNMVDNTTGGAQGSAKIYDFPECNLLFLGATCNLTVLAGVGGITDTAAVVASVGTAAASNADATLTATEADLIPSTAATLTAGAGTAKGKTATAGVVVFDGTTTAKDAYLNFAVPDAGSTGNDTLTVSGTITLVWSNLGDV